jgi:hypothetical protein
MDDELLRKVAELRPGWDRPDRHLRRTWLPASYVPGPCPLCGEVCDLRSRDSLIVVAYGAPVEVHDRCANKPDLWDNSPLKRNTMFAAISVAYFAWPDCRRYTLPEGAC